MKAARTPGAVVLLATCWMLGGWSRGEESGALERFNRAQEILREIEPQLLIERAVFNDELERGAGKDWSDWEKENAAEKVRGAFQLIDEAQRRPSGVPKPTYSLSQVLNILANADPSAATTPLLGWLRLRVGTIKDVRDEARKALCAAALDYAEETWLAARTPADLEPAIRMVSEARRSIDTMWGMVSQVRGPGPISKPSNPSPRFGPLSVREAVDVYDFLSVLMSPEPFFLSDPTAHPAQFAVGHAIWPDLVRIGHAFTLRPAIATRFQHHDVVYRNLLPAVEDRLNELIEHNATAAEFEPPYLQWRGLNDPPPLGRQATLAKGGNIFGIADYRNLAARWPPYQGQPPIHPPPPEGAAYRAWLTLRQAEEKGDVEKIEQARTVLDAESRVLPSSTSAYLAARSRADEAKPPDAAEKAANPLDQLITRLRRFLPQENDGVSDEAKAVLAAWESLRDETARPPSDEDSSLADHWAAFSIRHGSHTLFTLRGRAARQLLTRLYPADAALPAAAAPLVTELRERLTAALTSGHADLAEKLLALDAAGAFLPPDEHQAWARDSAILREAAALLAAGERDSARGTYLRALRQLTDSTLGEFAARQVRVLKNPSIK